MSEFSITLAELFKAHILDVHVPNILVGITASIEVPLVTTVGRAINADHSQIAYFVLLSAICRTALDIPFGVLVESVGVRNVMLSCLVLSAVAALLGTRIGGFATMGIYCVLSGISLGGFFLARHIFVAGISSKKYRGTLMSFLSGLLRWSHVLGPLLTGIISSKTGNTKNAFYLAAATSLLAFVSLVAALYSPAAKKQCDHSCTTSYRTSAVQTPVLTDLDEMSRSSSVLSVAGNVPPLVIPAAAASAGTTEEQRLLVPPLHYPFGQNQSSSAVASVAMAGADEGCVAGDSIAKVHPSMGPHEEHFFRPSALWFTVVDYWPVIWRLGIYIVFFGALRSNRKLLLMFAGMRQKMSDAQISYLLSFSFAFDAMLFPLGGIIMDFLGRQFAMAPVALGLGLCFLCLPLCTTHTQLYMVSSAFGIADAMGCGVVMTLTADRAPKVYGAPFFGIMRTLADLGHVVGAGGVSFMVKQLGHDKTCLVLAVVGFATAAWGVFGVPRDTEPMETPRLDKAVAKHDRSLRHKRQQQQLLNGGGGGGAGWVGESYEERPLLPSEAQQRHGIRSQAYGAL